MRMPASDSFFPTAKPLPSTVFSNFSHHSLRSLARKASPASAPCGEWRRASGVRGRAGGGGGCGEGCVAICGGWNRKGWGGGACLGLLLLVCLTAGVGGLQRGGRRRSSGWSGSGPACLRKGANMASAA